MCSPEQVQSLREAQAGHGQRLAGGGRGVAVGPAVHHHSKEAIQDARVLVHATAVVVGGAADLVGVRVAGLVEALRHVHISQACQCSA